MEAPEDQGTPLKINHSNEFNNQLPAEKVDHLVPIG
jgi:hypothetical protein